MVAIQASARPPAEAATTKRQSITTWTVPVLDKAGKEGKAGRMARPETGRRLRNTDSSLRSGEVTSTQSGASMS